MLARGKVCAAGLVSALLVGCATAPHGIAPVVGASRDAVRTFGIEGRVAVRQGEQQSSAIISWSHRLTTDSLDVMSPLGQIVARLTREQGLARLETAERRVHEADTLDALSEQVFGVALPFSRVADWVLGRFAQGDILRQDAQQRPIEVQAEGWRLRYLDYEGASPQSLPTLMEFERGDTRVRLKVDQWTLP